MLPNLWAQKQPGNPAKFITKFNFIQLTGGVILLQGQFDNFKDTLSFILDTGSGGISLDSATTAYFNLKPEGSNRTIRGIAGIKNVSFLNNRKLHLPGITIDSLNFHVNDYSILTAVYGEPIDGIIGYSVFNRYIIKVDYDSSKIEFWTKGIMKYPRGGHLLKPMITNLPVQMAKVKDGRRIETRFLIDMGAGLNVLFNDNFIKDSSFLRTDRKLYVKEAEGLGGKIDMFITTIKELKLGPYKFKNVPANIFYDEHNVTSYPHLGGLIGNDLLRRFNAVFNYEKREIHLLPNSHYHDNFDYAYSGIELYYVNGLIIIGDVAKGSPAETAGLLEGDILVAVNTNFSQNMTQYKAILQSAGDKVRVIVRRKDELQQFELRVKNILKNK
ncbi:MAG: PDZ domain-containing protein [Chitinophagaceae bacterium]|nr:MAG: PDZ domain-containing protein [Chitinophagaceae bacterium]